MDRRETRVVDSQRQAKSSLGIAVAFMAAAAVTAVADLSIGVWLPLHLFLVGGLLSAISGATQLLAVTWSAAPAPPDRWAAVQRWSLACGAVLLAIGRESDLRAAVDLGALLVAIAMVVLGVDLLWIRARGTNERFRPAIDGYLMAVVWSLVAIGLGAMLALVDPGEWWPRVRAAHLTIALFGLVGTVIAATLPYFVATQARLKMSPRATPGAMRALSTALSVSVAVAVIGLLVDRSALAALGYGLYAVCLLAGIALLPHIGRKQLDWAGPRLIQLAAGGAWWVAMTVVLCVDMAGTHRWGLGTAGEGSQPEGVIRALVLGGYAQILVGSLAYFGPVLRAGGHKQLSAGFALTRSVPSLIAGNVAAIAALLGNDVVTVVAAVVWTADLVIRAVVLVRGSRAPAAP
ncbi:MAG: hypothetical protein ACK5O2_10950 [Microthrixaceae bacterium]